MNITQPLPRDPNFSPMTSVPSAPQCIALAVTNNASISSSASITLNTSTTYIEVTALTKGIFMKWGAVATSSSFDEFILANTTRCFGIPSGQTSVQFIEQAVSAVLIVIEK